MPENEVDHITVKFYRLITGEDIVATLVNETDTVVEILNPLKVVYMPSPRTPGSVLMSFGSWVYASIVPVQQFVLNKRDILLVSDVDAPVEKGYIESSAIIFSKVKPAKDASLADMGDMSGIVSAFEKLSEMLGELNPDDDEDDDEDPIDSSDITEEEKEAAKKMVSDWFEQNAANNKGKLH